VARRAWAADAASAEGTRAPDSLVPPGTPAVLAGGTFSDPGFREAVSAGLRRLGFDPRPLEFRPVDGLVCALREALARASTAGADPTDPQLRIP
jgi:hypothetical protein